MTARFPVCDLSLDTSKINIFQPSNQWERVQWSETNSPKPDLASRATPPAMTAAKTAAKPATAATSRNTSNANNTANTYCAACKKKFTNEATYNNHLKSAKHIANEKKKAKPAKPAEPATESAQDTHVADVLDRLHRFKQKNLEPKASLLLALAKDLYELKRPNDTYTTLKMAVDQSQTAQDIPEQDAIHRARLAAARLIAVYSPTMDEAFDLFLDSLDSRWNISKARLIQLAENCPSLPVATLVTECHDMVPSDSSLEYTANTLDNKSDSNHSLPVILSEAIHLFQHNDNLLSTSAAGKSVAIVLCCMAVAVYRHQQGPHAQTCMQEYMKQVAQIYASVGAIHRVSESFMVKATMVDLEPPSSASYQDTVVLALLNMWMALLHALEIEDAARVQEIQKQIQVFIELRCSFPDVELLLDIATARLKLDYGLLKYELADSLEHVQLLLETTDDPLILRRLPAEEHSALFARLRILTVLE